MTTHAATIEVPVARKRQPVPMNGVDTPKLFATIAAVRDQPASSSAPRAGGSAAPTCGAR
jgi:hypothetical protein